jgi:ATP-dependent Lon protease
MTQMRQEKIIGLWLKKDESDEDPTKDDIHTIGTVARILRVLKCLMEYYRNSARKNVLKLNRLLEDPSDC